jgi:hypothetical protein
LTQKGSKKVKTPPASHEKLAFVSGNRPNLFPPFVGNFKQGRFFPLSHWFFGSPDKVRYNNAKTEWLYYKYLVELAKVELINNHTIRIIHNR